MEETKNQGKTNIDLLGDCRPAYGERANRLKTRLQTKAQKEREQERIGQGAGLTAEQYWKTRVRSQEDVVTYYKIFKPEIPPEVAKAIAIRFTKLLEKINSKEEKQLTEEELRYFEKKKDCSESQWDLEKEIESHRTQGLINNSQKAMSELLNQI